jgi:hypothetical protein
MHGIRTNERRLTPLCAIPEARSLLLSLRDTEGRNPNPSSLAASPIPKRRAVFSLASHPSSLLDSFPVELSELDRKEGSDELGVTYAQKCRCSLTTSRDLCTLAGEGGDVSSDASCFGGKKLQRGTRLWHILHRRSVFSGSRGTASESTSMSEAEEERRKAALEGNC